VRRAYFQGQKDKVFASLAKARKKKPVVDWGSFHIVKPSFVGDKKVYLNYDLRKLVDYIDWDPFFQSW